jgi:hypothetical protein
VVEERDRADQREILLVVAPGAGVEEGERAGVGVGDEQRPQHALGVAVHGQRPLAFVIGQQALEGLPLALAAMDGARLLAVLVDREHETAIEQLVVDLDRRGGEHDHHRALHPVLVRDELPRGRVLARGGNRQLTFGLQELQCVAGALGTLLLDQGEDLVPQIGLAEVEERLSGHRRVLDALLLGHEGEDRLNERRLPCRRAR